MMAHSAFRVMRVMAYLMMACVGYFGYMIIFHESTNTFGTEHSSRTDVRYEAEGVAKLQESIDRNGYQHSTSASSRHSSAGLDSHEQSPPPPPPPSPPPPPPHPAPDHVTKVVLYTYMRSGSTLTGEFLAQDTETFYLFEAVDGMMSHLYGVKSGSYPIDLFYYTDGTKRILSDAEKQFIVDTTLQILSCNFTLPADVTFQRFMVERVFPSTKAYVNCLNAEKSGIPSYCKTKIEDFCPPYFNKTGKTSEKCFNHFHVKPDPEFVDLDEFRAHEDCMGKATSRATQCKPLLTEACLAQKVRSFKAIRLSMEMLEAMIVKEPDLRIVYLVRDPRGILKSRQATGEMSVTSRKDLLKEAKVLCHRMTFDTEVYTVLAQQYPRNILRVRYEDIAVAPVEQAQRIYTFIRDVTVPQTVRAFIDKSMNTDANDGWYGTARKNATATAYSWRAKLTRQEIENINNLCDTVIRDLGYTL